jgi:predicted nicotinamide N-methyase
MQPATPSTTELRDLPQPLPETPADLPDIPGGWTERTWNLGGRSLRLFLPAVPDAFLDDPQVAEAHARDEYMPYWAFLWPASLHLAQAVCRQPWPPGTPLVELGAGLGLVGLAALAAGYRVTFTDYDPLAVHLCRVNALRNGFDDFQAEVVDWRSPPDWRFPVILGCELLYEDRNHEPLLELTRRWLAPGGWAWFADGGRTRAERFFRMLPRYGLEATIVDETGAVLSKLRVGRYQCLVVRRASARSEPAGQPPEASPPSPRAEPVEPNR